MLHEIISQTLSTFLFLGSFYFIIYSAMRDKPFYRIETGTLMLITSGLFFYTNLSINQSLGFFLFIGLALNLGTKSYVRSLLHSHHR